MSADEANQKPPADAGRGLSEGLGVSLSATWRRARPGRFDDEAHTNLIAAIPNFPNPPMSTMQIWHACDAPKPSYSRARFWLRDLADSDLGVERVGGSSGAQFYRWMD